jgi:hypothetical protein
MRPDVVRLGGFDSHTFPPPPAAVTPPFPPSRSRDRAAWRRVCRTALLAGAVAGAALLPREAPAQQRDSLRAGAAARRDTTPGVDLPRPPISPRRAFLTSFLLPGYGQARLGRPTASAFFLTVEVASALMLGKTIHDVGVARRYLADSVPATYAVDATTGQVRRDSTGAAVVESWAPGQYTTDLLRARRLQREDWIAALFFNHVVAGAEAYVSAHLWDVPAAVSISADPRGGATVVASLRW